MRNEADAEGTRIGVGDAPTAGRVAFTARLVLLSLLIVFIALGLHGHTASPVWDRHSQAYDAVVAGAMEAVVVVLLIAVALRRRRASPGPATAAQLRTVLSYVLVAAMVALAVLLVVLLVDVRLPRAGPVPPAAVSPSRAPRGHSAAPGRSGPGSHFPLSQVLYALAAALLLAAMVAVALRLAAHGRRRLAPEPGLPAEEYGQVLQDAVRRGQRALMQLDDARAAIIACYVAMEATLARAGTARASAETPDELLARAATMLSSTTTAATRLTALFYEARFSTHPLGAGQRQAAERSLAELAEQLEDAASVVPTGIAPFAPVNRAG